MKEIQYTDPSSVESIMEAVGNMKGILNSDTGLYIYMGGKSLHAQKGDYVQIHDNGAISIRRENNGK